MPLYKILQICSKNFTNLKRALGGKAKPPPKNNRPILPPEPQIKGKI